MNDSNLVATYVLRQARVLERKRHGGARLAQDRARAPVLEPGRKIRGTHVGVRDLAEPLQRGRHLGAVSAGACDVYDEPVSIQVPSDVRMNGRVCAEARLAVEKQD